MRYRKDCYTTANGKRLCITFIKHASLMIDMNGFILYVDPVTKYGDRYEDFPKADAILITHEHKDHFEPELIIVLSDDKTILLVSETIPIGKKLTHGHTYSLSKEIAVESVPAYNVTESRMYHPKERHDNGYIIEFDSLRIYVAGDTEDISEMDDIKGINIAFLPVNQPYTMTPEQCANAIKRLTPRIVYPYHYGDTDLFPVIHKYESTYIQIKIRQMQ